MAARAQAKGKAKTKQAAPRIRLTMIRSTIGFDRKQELAIEGLGLRRIGHTVEREDTPSIRGLILKVRHLVRVEGE